MSDYDTTNTETGAETGADAQFGQFGQFGLSQGAQAAGKILSAIGGVALIVAAVVLPIAALIGFVLALISLRQAIYDLGHGPLAVSTMLADVVSLSVVATLVLVVVATVALTLKAKRRTLLLAGLVLVFWLFLAVALALLNTWMTVANIIPDLVLLRIGVFAYSALPALPVIPLVLLASSASHEREDQYPTLAAAGGASFFTLLKAILALAMFVFESFFGVQLGINPIAAVFAGMLNAIAFSMALGNLSAAAQAQDRGGVRQWGAISLGYAVLMFVIAIEAIVKLSKASGSATQLDALAIPSVVSTAAQFAFVSSIGLSALLVALTYWRNAQHEVAQAGPARVIEGEVVQEVQHPRSIGTRIANQIRAARAARTEIAGAWRGLPAPSPESAPVAQVATMANDEQAAQLIGVAKPTDTTVVRTGAKHNNNASHSNAAPKRRERRTAARVDADRVGGDDPKG